MRAPRTANVRSMVNSLRVRELQIVLAELNLARSGRKLELIDRIVHALEQFEIKATENASNHATAAFYNDQLEAALRCLQTQVNATRAGSSAAATASSSGMSAPPPPQPPAASSGYAARTPPPVVYGRPIPFNGHARAPSTHHHLVPPAASAQSNATEVLHATTPAAVNGARCFCGSAGAASGKVVACVECGLHVHAKCHQLVNAPASEKNDWYCEVCRAELCDPFLRVKKTVRAPVFVKFNRNQALQRIEYTITDQDLNDLYSNQDRAAPGAMTPGKLELQLRCFILKEELGTGTSWPTTSVIAANGFGLQLVQRAPPGQSNPSKVLREQPSNLFPYSRVGRNVIEVRTGENPVVFCFMVQIVEFRNVADIVNEVRAASESITYEDAKKEVIKSFGGGDDDDDDDDAVVATSTVLSLRCPLGLCLIDLPARGLHCKHLQCFDLKTFLTFNKKARSRHYRCTVCHNFIKASDLRIDPYLKKLLREVQADEDLEEVEILPDATWKRRAGDEAEVAPPPKRVKTELGDLSITPAATTTAAPSIAAAATTGSGDAGPGSANAPFEIDLSLSSDEEDDGLGAIPTLTATTGTPSTASATTSTANLSDDDIPIFTVDSDVWELPPGNVNASGNDMPFPMDIFSTFGAANGGNHVDLSTGNGNWTTSAAASYSAMPSLTATSTTSSAFASSTPAWAASSSSNSSTATAAGSARGSEVGLANAMAQLSRNHPHVNNPFDARRSAAPPKPAASAGGSGGGGSSTLDVICLLDSDSE